MFLCFLFQCLKWAAVLTWPIHSSLPSCQVGCVWDRERGERTQMEGWERENGEEGNNRWIQGKDG